MRSKTILLIAAAVLLFPQSGGLENLGEGVNTRFDELSPIISPDGKTLFFIRGNRDDSRQSSAYRILTSRREDKGWAQAVEMPPPFNQRIGVNMMCGMTADGRSILINGSQTASGFTGTGFSLVTRSNDSWGAPVKLPVKGLDDLVYGKDAAAVDATQARTKNLPGAFLGSDGTTLMLYVYDEDTGFDLYISFLSNKAWSLPVSLGEPVNSERNEITPFLAADNATLYYASDRSGNYDIYMTRRLDASGRKWSAPMNLGAPINTAGWEGYFTTDAKGEYAYIVSYKNAIGKGDIFRTKLDPRFRPGVSFDRTEIAGVGTTTVDSRTTVASRSGSERFNDDLKSAYDAIMRRVETINRTVADINAKTGVIPSGE